MSATVSQLLQQAEEKAGKGNWEEAIRFLDLVLQQVPEHGDALHFLGLIKYQMGDLKAAIPLLKKAVEITEGHPAVLANYGSVLNAIKAWSESETVNREVIEKDPNNTQGLVSLSTSLMELGKLEDALEPCEKAAQIDKANPSVQITLGNIYHRLGKLGDAVHSFERAANYDPNNALAYANLGVVLRESGKLEAAKAACCKAIELRPSYAEAYNNLGVILVANNDSKAALAAFEKALSLVPTFFDAEVNRGGVL
jgi:tetratricopeptide (TPR) repeat protein